jgi:hypothetical protein
MEPLPHCISFCHTLGNRLLVGETQDETSFNVLVQFPSFTFSIGFSSFLCKTLQMVTTMFLDSPLHSP